MRSSLRRACASIVGGLGELPLPAIVSLCRSVGRPRSWVRWLIGASVVGLALVIIWALLVPGSDWLARHDINSAKGSLATARDAARGRLLTLGAGLLAAGALLFTARSFTLSREGQVTDRYTKAIEQLGTREARRAHRWHLRPRADCSGFRKDHPTVMEVLTAFVREHSHEQQPLSGPGSAEQERLARPDVHSAVTVVGRRDTKHDIRPIDLSGANLTRADLTGAPQAPTPGADLRGAHFVRASLVGADLTEADLGEAHLYHAADLRGADLSRASLVGADLIGANLATMDGGFTRAKLTGADLSGARLDRANLTEAELSGANFARANLNRAHLTAADFTDADLIGANLDIAVLAYARLTGADLTGADLRSAHLSGADLTGANLRGANLDNVEFACQDLTESADLTEADLRGAYLSGVRLASANLARAELTGATWPTADPAPEGWMIDGESGVLKPAGQLSEVTAHYL